MSGEIQLEKPGAITPLVQPPPKKRMDWDDVDLGIMAIGLICVLLLILLIVYLLTKDNANVGGILGVIGSGITAIATLAGRRVKTPDKPPVIGDQP